MPWLDAMPGCCISVGLSFSGPQRRCGSITIETMQASTLGVLIIGLRCGNTGFEEYLSAKEMARLMLYSIELAALSYRFNDPYQKSDLHGSNITN